jgi:hypothetical protein
VNRLLVFGEDRYGDNRKNAVMAGVYRAGGNVEKICVFIMINLFLGYALPIFL